MEQEKKDQRVTIMMSEKELAAVDTWAHDNRIKSRGEAVRLLLNASLQLLPRLKRLRRSYDPVGNPLPEQKDAISSLMINLLRIEAAAKESGGSQPPAEEFGTHAFTGGDAELMFEIADYTVTQEHPDEMTDREGFVVDRIQEGHDDEAIANIMGVSERAMKSYVLMLTKKFQAAHRDDLPNTAPISIKLNPPTSTRRALKLD